MPNLRVDHVAQITLGCPFANEHADGGIWSKQGSTAGTVNVSSHHAPSIDRRSEPVYYTDTPHW